SLMHIRLFLRTCFLLAVSSVWTSANAQVNLSVPPSPSESAKAEFQRKLKEYTAARQEFEVEEGTYWRNVAEKRRQRANKRLIKEPLGIDDYVLVQPPNYTGPSKPVDPAAVAPEPQPRKVIPIVDDFLKAAREQFGFKPDRPDEISFKRAYARVAAAAGLTKDQVVRIYAFESGGNG